MRWLVPDAMTLRLGRIDPVVPGRSTPELWEVAMLDGRPGRRMLSPLDLHDQRRDGSVALVRAVARLRRVSASGFSGRAS